MSADLATLVPQPTPLDVPPRPGVGAFLWSLARTARPKQWIKNVLIFAAPAAAGVLGHLHPLLMSVEAFLIFCVSASGTYFVNDALDAQADRRHPVKQSRPVAAGVIGRRTAFVTGVLLMVVSVGAAEWAAGPRLLVVVVVYLTLSTAYSMRLKHEPVLDLAILSSGFILRAIAGGVATHVPLSDWFLIVVSFGALFVATGKRSAEHLHLGEDRADHRPVLAQYPPTFLRSVRLLSSAVTITGYCLWAFGRAASVLGGHRDPIWLELSIVPVVIALLHLELRYESGSGAAPEELALRDRSLQAMGLVWVALFAIGIYA